MPDRPLRKAKLATNLRPAIRIGRIVVLGSLLFAGSIPSPTQQTPTPQRNVPASASIPVKAPTQPPQPSPQSASATPSPAAAPTEDQPGSAADRKKAILAHLNAVLRYYHDADAPLQKVGEPSDLIYR